MAGKRGSSLLTVMMVLSAGMFLVFTAATASTYMLRFNTAQDDRDTARNLAESAIYRAIAALQDADDYGKSRTQTVTIQDADYRAGALGYLSFVPVDAHAQSISYSTNNLGTIANVTGDGGRVVTHDTAHLVSLGKCGDRRLQLECIYFRPAFPKGVASSGAVRAEALTLAGVRNPDEFTGDLTSVTADNQFPASIFSNSPDATAVNVGVACNVTGNAGAVGKVVVEPGSVVGGEIRQNTSAQAVPNLNVNDMINRVRNIQGLFPFNPGAELTDYAYEGGSLNIPGDLVLNGGVLAVANDLTVGGAVRGRGAVLAGGRITITQGASLETGSQVVLAAHGDVALQASAREGYYFQGMLYSEGNVHAEKITVLGGVVANGGPGQGKVELINCSLIQTPVSFLGGYALPKSMDLGGEDSVRMQLASRPDPDHPGQYLFFGSAWYGQHELGGDGYPDPSEGRWKLLLTPPEAKIVEGSPAEGNWPQTFAGSEGELLAQMAQLADSDGGSYGDEILPYLVSVIAKLSGKGTGVDVLDLNFNNLLTPVERSRVLIFREVPED